ncbi:hypothetical protein WMY93_026808 [Mugilogobius chulae]|uniref:G-protein coupled receptors family 1 profile domain-containing protein n=1 Tax=Mugilogobius chulae TaxID=88201 RepID=A0AAW0NB71_9GOBI
MEAATTTYTYDYDDGNNIIIPPCESKAMNNFISVFVPLLYTLVFILGFVGNGLVVCVLLKHSHKSNLTDICLLNLAVSDLLFLLILPLYAHYSATSLWVFGDFMCHISGGLHNLGFYSCTFFMVVMTLDRYVLIQHAQKASKYRTMKTGMVLTTCVWALSFCVSLPAFIVTQQVTAPENFSCEYSPEEKKWLDYNIFATNILGLVLPFTVMVINMNLSDDEMNWTEYNGSCIYSHDDTSTVPAFLYILFSFGILAGPLQWDSVCHLHECGPYLAIVHAVAALRARSLHYGIIISIIIWIVSIVMAIPGVIFANVELDEDDGSLKCGPLYPAETVADVLLVCTLPFLAHQAWDQWRFGDVMCKLVLGIYHIVLYCGIFLICLMSIDRYLAIVHAVHAMRVSPNPQRGDSKAHSICKMNTTTSSQWSMATSSPALKALTSMMISHQNLTTRSPDVSTTDYYDYSEMDLTDFFSCSSERHGAYILPILYSLFFVLGILGNSLVLWVIMCGVRLRSMTDVCLLNLAVADVLLVCTLPFLAHQAWDQWRFGDVMCKLVLGIYHIVLYCGIFLICLMSIDRYLAIVHAVHAMRVRTRSFGMITAAVTWIAGFCASFPDIIFLQQTVNNETMSCFPLFPKNEQTQDTSGESLVFSK